MLGPSASAELYFKQLRSSCLCLPVFLNEHDTFLASLRPISFALIFALGRVVDYNLLYLVPHPPAPPRPAKAQTVTDELEKHQLVALVSFVSTEKQDPASRCPGFTYRDLEYGTTDGHTRKKIRAFPLLDVISSISASWGKSQGAAVALQFEPPATRSPPNSFRGQSG